MNRLRSLTICLIGVCLVVVAIGLVTAPARLQEHPPQSNRTSQPEHLTDEIPSNAATVAGIEPSANHVSAEIPDEGPQPRPEPLPPMTVVAEAAEGYIVFVEGAGDVIPGASPWPQAKLEALIPFYEAAFAMYTGDEGFGSAERWAAECGISRENPLRVAYAGSKRDPAPARAGWKQGTPVITHYTLRTAVQTVGIQLVVHEMAHIWDGAHDYALGEAITTTVRNPGGFPTAKARDEGPKEDFAESVTSTLWPGYAVNAAWSDDEPRGESESTTNTAQTLDRSDYIQDLFKGSQGLHAQDHIADQVTNHLP